METSNSPRPETSTIPDDWKKDWKTLRDREEALQFEKFKIGQRVKVDWYDRNRGVHEWYHGVIQNKVRHSIDGKMQNGLLIFYDDKTKHTIYRDNKTAASDTNMDGLDITLDDVRTTGETVDELCPEGHPLEKRDVNKHFAYANGLECNVCSGGLETSKVIYSCRVGKCDYDVHEKCLRPTARKPSPISAQVIAPRTEPPKPAQAATRTDSNRAPRRDNNQRPDRHRQTGVKRKATKSTKPTRKGRGSERIGCTLCAKTIRRDGMSKHMKRCRANKRKKAERQKANKRAPVEGRMTDARATHNPQVPLQESWLQLSPKPVDRVRCKLCSKPIRRDGMSAHLIRCRRKQRQRRAANKRRSVASGASRPSKRRKRFECSHCGIVHRSQTDADRHKLQCPHRPTRVLKAPPLPPMPTLPARVAPLRRPPVPPIPPTPPARVVGDRRPVAGIDCDQVESDQSPSPPRTLARTFDHRCTCCGAHFGPGNTTQHWPECDNAAETWSSVPSPTIEQPWSGETSTPMHSQIIEPPWSGVPEASSRTHPGAIDFLTTSTTPTSRNAYRTPKRRPTPFRPNN